MTERKPETAAERHQRLADEAAKALKEARKAGKPIRVTVDRVDDLDDLDDEELLELHDFVTWFAQLHDLPTPWADPDTPPEERIEFARRVAELEGRPHLATDLILRDPDLVAGWKSREGGRSSRRTGKERRKVPDDVLEEAMLALKAEGGGGRSWSGACGQVAEKVGMSKRQVQRRMQSLKEDW